MCPSILAAFVMPFTKTIQMTLLFKNNPLVTVILCFCDTKADMHISYLGAYHHSSIFQTSFLFHYYPSIEMPNIFAKPYSLYAIDYNFCFFNIGTEFSINEQENMSYLCWHDNTLRMAVAAVRKNRHEHFGFSQMYVWAQPKRK